MSKQVLLNQAVLEFRGEFELPGSITNDLEKTLQRADWNELLKPVLRGIPARIHVVDTTGPERAVRKTSKPRRSGRKGTFCVEITRVGYGTHTFEIPNATAEEAQTMALSRAGNHAFSEKHSEYEVQAVHRKL